MAKENKQKSKVTLLGYDPVETPEEVMDKDKDTARKEAFKESYKRVMQIIPDYFLEQRKKRKNGTTGGGTSFTQNIVITPENVKIETMEKGEADKQEEKERED